MSVDSGLAMAILIGMALMVITPALALGLVGLAVGRRRDAAGAFGGIGFVVGALIGLLGVVVTFYEDTFAPELVLEVPEDLAHEDIFIVEDPTASQVLRWNAVQTEARLTVPKTGVARVRDLEDFVGGPLEARLTSGEHNTVASSRPPPEGVTGRSVLCFGFRASGDARTSDCERENVADLIGAREARDDPASPPRGR